MENAFDLRKKKKKHTIATVGFQHKIYKKQLKSVAVIDRGADIYILQHYSFYTEAALALGPAKPHVMYTRFGNPLPSPCNRQSLFYTHTHTYQ